jgi:hypothetical protein
VSGAVSVSDDAGLNVYHLGDIGNRLKHEGAGRQGQVANLRAEDGENIFDVFAWKSLVHFCSIL